MKQRFKPDQEVVCNVSGVWETLVTKTVKRFFWKKHTVSFETLATGPRHRELYTVDGYQADGRHLFLKEYPRTGDGKRPCFHEDAFDATMDLSEFGLKVRERDHHK